MEEKRQRGEDKVDIPHDVMERIGQQADPSTQAGRILKFLINDQVRISDNSTIW